VTAGIAVTTEIEVNSPIDLAFGIIVPIELATIFRGMGPLPAVLRTREQTGPWDHVGATRTVELSDGSAAHERLTAYHAPAHFAYRLDDFTGAFRLLVTHADGAWWFSPTPRGTHVRWTYIFYPRTGRAAVVRAVVAPLWTVYQRRAMELAAQAARARA
jgi:hypothetical protein